MLHELNRRLECLSYNCVRLFLDKSGFVWLEEPHASPSKEPVMLGSLLEARRYVETLEREERMVAVMS